MKEAASMASATVGWSELPHDLLQDIFKRLVLSDHLSFKSVCTSWRTAVAQSKSLLRDGSCKFVGLVVPGKSPNSETRRLLQPSFRSSGFYYEDDTEALNIAVPHRYHCCGSKYGWLILVNDSLDMHLFNPLSASKIQLPSVNTADPLAWRVQKSSKFIVTKAFLSSDPSSSSSETFVLMIYYGGDMAFCRLGDDAWTVIKPLNDCRYNSDAIYHNEKFYVVYNPGGLVTIDIHTPTDEGVVQIEYAREPPLEIFVQKRYLVESNGDLFQIRRIEMDAAADDDASTDYGESDDDNDVSVGDGDNGNQIADIIGVGENGKPAADNNGDVDNGNQLVDNDGDKGNQVADNNGDGDGDGENENQIGENQIANNNGGGDDGNQIADNDDDGEGELNVVSSNSEDGYEARKERFEEVLRRIKTRKFKIFKLAQCSSCGHHGWQRVKNIGDKAFFIGYHGSFSISASELCCQPNSIYFTNNNVYMLERREPMHHDIGVYNLHNNRVQEIYPVESKPVWPTSFWFGPFHGEKKSELDAKVRQVETKIHDGIGDKTLEAQEHLT